MPIVYQDPALPKRKRKGRREEPPTPPPVPQPAGVSMVPSPTYLTPMTSGGGSDYYTQLALAETASVGTLPTTTVDAMVRAGMEDDDVWKASSIFAQITDLSPRWFLPNKDEYTFGDMADPITGVPLSFSEARAAFKVYEPFYVYALLTGRLDLPVTPRSDEGPRRPIPIDTPRTMELTPTPTEDLGTGRPLPIDTPRGGIDAHRLAAAFQALSAVDGDALKFQDALAWGMDIAADESFDLEVFGQNLAMVERARGVFTEEGTGTYSPMRALAIATEMTRRGYTFTDPKEVLLAMDPALAGMQEQMLTVDERLVEYFGQDFVDRAKADPESDEGQYYLGERNAELSRLGWGLTDLSIFEGMLDAVANTETDYIEAGEQIAEDIRLSKEGTGIGGTVVGRWFLDWVWPPLEWGINNLIGTPERIGLDPAIWAMTPKGQMFGVTRPTIAETNVEAIQAGALQGAMADARDFWFSRGNTFYLDEIAKEGVPVWVATIVDLVAGFKFGPDILALRAIGKAHQARWMAAPAKWTEFLDHTFKWRALGGQRGVTLPEAIANAARSETRAEVMLTRLTDDLTGYFGAGLHPTISSELFMLARADLRAGRAYIDVVGDIREALLYGAGASSHGKYATRLSQMWENQKAAAEKILVKFDRPDSPAVEMLAQAQRAKGAYGGMPGFRWEQGIHPISGLPIGGSSDLLIELPHLRNPLSRSLGALGSGRLADTAFGRAIDAITNTTPPRGFNRLNLNLEDANLLVDAEAALVRSRVFNVTERAEYLTRLGGFQNPLNPYRERLFMQWIDDVNAETVKRIAAQHGLSAEQMKKVQSILDERLGKYAGRADTYGAYTKYTEIGPHTYMPESVFVHEPYMPSQLLNTATIWDPIALRHGIAEAVGTMRQARNAIMRAVHVGVPKAKFAKTIRDVSIRRALDNVWEAIVHDLFLGIWKPLVVMRPAYILRVVGLEEQGRFLSTVGGMQRLEASRIAGRLVGRFGHRTISMDVPMLGRTTDEIAEAFIDTTVRNIGGKATHDLVPNVTDLGGGMARVDIPTPASGLLARQTYAETQANRFALTGQEGVLHEAVYGRSWEPMARGSRDFTKFWRHDLVRQFGEDAVGQMHLKSIVLGMEEEDAIKWITDMLMSEQHRNTTGRLMGSARYTRSQVEMQVRTGQSVATTYTVGRQAEIADLALKGTLTPEFLAGIPEKLHPAFIHGPEIEMVLARVGPLKRGRDALGNIILRMPTNAFSRSPYAASWYSRTREAMLRAFGTDTERVAPLMLRKGEMAGVSRETTAHHYYYHATTPENVEGIARDGLLPRLAAENLSDEAAVYFGSLPVHASNYTSDMSTVLLRVRRGEIGLTNLGSGEFRTLQRVRPEALEYLGADKAWHALVPETKALTPEILRGIDRAAEKFAKLQVNRIMFDFTRSGRFGEMTAFVFPFFQPYTEAFLVWGRILRQNPATLGYVRHLITTADKSGLLEKNQWGDRVVPLTNWMMGARFLQMFTGAPGWQLSAPFESFNLFFQSAVPIPTGPILGDFPLPLPAMAPPFMAVMQMALNSNAVEDGLDPEARSRLLSWAFEFGNITAQSMLPSYARHFVEYAVPGWFENEMNNQADNALRLLAWQGVTAERLANDPAFAMEQAGQTFQFTQKDGTVIPDVKAASQWLAGEAEGMAKSVALWRGFASLLFPAAPRLEWPHSEWLEELRTIREQYPDDWEAVKDTFLTRHPDGWQFLISNSTWNDELAGNSTVPIPASEAVQRFFAGKGAREFAEKFPQFAFFIIPHELRDGQYDPGVLWAQVRAGQRGVLTPYGKLIEEAEQRGWDTYFDLHDAWLAWQEAHPDANIGDPDYLVRKAIYDDAVDQLKLDNNIWADDYGSFVNKTGVDPKVLAHAWLLSKDELFLKTDLGQALRVFLPKMEAMQATLSSYAISNITNVAAQEMGLTDRWDGLLNYLSETFGEDWDRAYDLFFSKALEGVTSRTEKYMAGLSLQERKPIYQAWEEVRALDERIDSEQNELVKSQLYQERREQAAAFIREFGTGMENPMRLLWESKDPREKTRSREFLASLPYYWLSEFDRRVVLGEKTSPAAEEAWAWYANQRNGIQWRENHDPDFSSGAAYDKLDKELARRAKKSKILAAQVERANDWSYLFFKAHPELLEDTNVAQDEWRKLKKFSDKMKAAYWDSGLVTGSDLTYDADYKTWYRRLYESWDKWLQTDLFDNVDFKVQFEDLQKRFDDPILRYFVPTTYYPIGGGE